MLLPVDTKDPAAVEREVQATYTVLAPGGSPEFVPSAFQWIRDCFEGRYSDYLPIDAQYHDLEHTLQGTLCMARLLRARLEAGGRPALTQRLFELGLLAMLFHDTGYLKRGSDPQGTGAKYTFTHVARSVGFAEAYLGQRGLPLPEIRSVQNMIRCTGVHVDLGRIPFQSEMERVVGHALGTADLLGQMAAPDYIDKLGILYAEFEESARFYEGKVEAPSDFRSAEELIRGTPAFWRGYVRAKLDQDFWGIYRFMNRPYPHGPNPYVEQVDTNMRRLEERLGLAGAQP